MWTDRELVELCSDLYSGAGSWDFLKESPLFCVGVKRENDQTAIVWRGSKTPMDWLEDLGFAAAGTVFGPVHEGMWGGVLLAQEDLKEWTKGEWISAGHSLGGAHALLWAALMVEEGAGPQRIVTAGAPRCGRDSMWAQVARVPKAIYENEGDPVPFLPPNFVRPPKATRIKGPALMGDGGILRFHHVKVYLGGMA